jgi:hypothetical protein
MYNIPVSIENKYLVMILTTHALIGAAIGKNIDNPWLIILLAFSTHFFFDSFRHGEYIAKLEAKKDWAKVFIDIIFGMSVVCLSLFWSGSNEKIIFNTLLGSFFGALPDLFIVLYQKFNFRLVKIFVDLGTWVHPYAPGSPETLWTLRNAVNDIIFSLIAIFLLFY